MKPLINFNEITKASLLVNDLLSDFDASEYKQRTISISTMTKKILAEMIKRDTKDKELKKLAYRLEPSFFDEIFDNFLTISDKEQQKFIEILSVYKKRIFKNSIFQNILINYNHANTKKMTYLFSDLFKPSILKLPYLDFINIIESPSIIYTYYQRSKKKGMFSFTQQIEPTCESPLSINLLKSLINQSCRIEYLSSENELLYNFLVNHFTDEEGANYGLHYLKIFDTKSYDPKIIAYIIKCKNNIEYKYRELANELDLLLYKIYEYSLVYDDYKEIADELAMTLTNKIISEAFGDDERSLFWKQYTKFITEPILFVKSPITMFMMKFQSVGIIEYIDIGNATYLYDNDSYHRIKNKLLSSARNDKNILNIQSHLRTTGLKEITKVGFTRYTHRGSWKAQFQSDMRRKYNLHVSRQL
jgi:hypothetical protein